jgi:hypothetical protein
LPHASVGGELHDPGLLRRDAVLVPTGEGLPDKVSDANARAWIEREARNCGHPVTCVNCAIQAVAAAVQAKGEEPLGFLEATFRAPTPFCRDDLEYLRAHAADVPPPPEIKDVMKPLASCANGDGQPVQPPSKVLCRACFEALGEKLKGLIEHLNTKAADVPAPPKEKP